MRKTGYLLLALGTSLAGSGISHPVFAETRHQHTIQGSPAKDWVKPKADKAKVETLPPEAKPSGTVAGRFDSSAQGADKPLKTDGWNQAEVDQFHLDAADPPFVTGEFIDTWLKRFYPDSPLIGYGKVIKEKSDQYGIAVGAFMGQIAKETVFGRSSCGGRYNLGCLRWYEGAPFGPVQTAYGPFQNIDTIEAGIESYFKLARTGYVDKGYINYKDYLDRYSPASDGNDQASFKNIFWGAIRAFGYDVRDTTRKVPKP